MNASNESARPPAHRTPDDGPWEWSVFYAQAADEASRHDVARGGA